MAEATSQKQKNQEYGESEKKLRKREKRLLDHLDEAYIAQKNAAERFQRAEARLLKRLARTQRLEARLAMLRQQLETFASSNVTVASLNTDTSLQPGDDITEERPQEESMVPEDETDIAAKARVARAVAIATEQAARLAVERALHVALRLEHMVTGRHLSQELLNLEAEAAQASVAALDAELAAQAAERLASADPIAVTLPLETVDGNNVEAPVLREETDENVGETLAVSLFPPKDGDSNADTTPSQITAQNQNVDETPTNEDTSASNANETPIEETISDETTTNTHTGLPTPVEYERVEEIEEDEERVAMVAAMMIADVAAANAAKAESFAEEASARTAEARHFAQEADAVLERIRAAIRSGASSGDAAEAILFDAERDATHTHATLADAEAAEERARRAAMEAEAEAEVAEGMAFATEDRNEHDEMRREEEPSSSSILEGQQHTGDTGEIERLAKNITEKHLEDEDTIEVPIVRPM